MPLHPEIVRFLRTLPAQEQGASPDHSAPDPRAIRAAEAAQIPPVEQRLPLYRVEDAVAHTAVGEVPVRIFTPDGADVHGVVVYIHGGAFFSGSIDTHDHITRSLASETGCTVVSVGYRLAPEAPFPSGLQDCSAVVGWVAENAERLGWDRRTLALAGDSSGGGFAAAVAAKAHDDGLDLLTHQILYYPSLDLDFDIDRYASLRENAEGYGLETAGLKPFNSLYLNSGADPDDPLVSPVKRADLSGLPPALILTAEYDPLRDEGELYGRRLQEAGVEATVHRYPGANHGFVQHFSWIPEFHLAFTETAAFLNGE